MIFGRKKRSQREKERNETAKVRLRTLAHCLEGGSPRWQVSTLDSDTDRVVEFCIQKRPCIYQSDITFYRMGKREHPICRLQYDRREDVKDVYE